MAKFCQKCGTELNKDDTFCSNCGEAVNKDNTNSNNSANTTVVNNSNNYQPKSKIAAGILGLIPITGMLGIHNFYLGYNGKAIGQLLMTILSCGALAIASWIWSLVEGIMILTGSINKDAQGNDLVD